MHAHVAYPPDSPAYPTSGRTSSPGYGAPAPRHHESSGRPPRSPMCRPMHHSVPTGATPAHSMHHMHDYHAYPTANPEHSAAQPPLPPEPAPPPPRFYRSDVQTGRDAAQKRMQSFTTKVAPMQSMIGAPSTVPQALNMGLYDAAKLFMRRSHHHSSQRRTT
jgi:hypothetical protein